MDRLFVRYGEEKWYFDPPPGWKVLTFASFRDSAHEPDPEELTRRALNNPVLSASLNLLAKQLAGADDRRWEKTMERAQRNLLRLLDMQYKIEDLESDNGELTGMTLYVQRYYIMNPMNYYMNLPAGDDDDTSGTGSFRTISVEKSINGKKLAPMNPPRRSPTVRRTKADGAMTVIHLWRSVARSTGA